jgi:hypothetical protein
MAKAEMICGPIVPGFGGRIAPDWIRDRLIDA